MGRILAAVIMVLTAISSPAWAQATYKLRASVDTSPSHARTISVADYLKTLQERSGGRIQTELFSSGQLFRDRDVAKALRQGAIEMAVPGSWVLTGFVPDADVFQLPAFFGQPAPVVYGAVDGGVGKAISDELEAKLGVKPIGAWLPLGYQNTYSTGKPIHSFADLAGMKIRNSGGAGQAIRAKFFNAQPNMTAWPDVPLALSQGTFDGLSSTDESLASAKLWDSGVKYGFEDHEFIGFYIPMVSDGFYKKLPPDLQKLLVDVWNENIATYRSNMEAAQTRARKTLEANGIVFVAPPDTALADIRKRMLPMQDAVAKELRITPALQQLVSTDKALNGS
ncbi:TRAP transporter substrate-binding protein DctP [Acidisphaera sp. L21]|uniref:TRAP transporter substrate-binding protein DctP n=1 Tax=Acidisphaera sp. L21 TaxID=1641851 RepID=UPI00131C073C|nr:TRAP transporter substrate-binding protein DctP [Acidisphaera sp. L21]